MADNKQTTGIPVDVHTLIERGLTAAEEENYEDAADLFSQAVDVDPSNARARYNLALAQQNLGDLEGAVATYLRAIQLDPNLIEAYINLGHLYGEIGLDEEAVDIFQRAIELDSGNDALFVALGDAYRELGFYDDAIQAYRQAQILNADNTIAQDNLRDVRESVNQQAQRINELESQLDNDPSNIERYAEVIGAYLEARRYQDALNSTNQMIELFPDDSTVYETLALVQEALGDVDSAAAAWEKMTQVEPENVDAWEHLGTWRVEQGLMDEAIAAYRQAVKLAPESPAAHFNLAETLLEASEFNEAIAVYQGMIDGHLVALNADELKTDAYIGLAEAQNGAQLFAPALESCEKLLAEYPDEPMGLYQKATALDGLGRHEEAIDAYIASLENDPLNADAYNDLADTYIEVGDLDNAIEMAQRAIALAPEMDVAYETLAQALHGAGRHEEAVEAEKQAVNLQQAVELSDEDFTALNN